MEQPPDHLDDEAFQMWMMATDVIERHQDSHLVMTALWIRRELRDESIVAELRQRVASLEGQICMTVDRLGGKVEGKKTHEGNFLQRIDELRAIEKRRQR